MFPQYIRLGACAGNLRQSRCAHRDGYAGTDSDDNSTTDAATGTGPVDAVYKAINRIIDVPNRLTEYRVDAVTEGIDALGDVTIRIEKDDHAYVGRGSDTDIIVASAKAYMNALNRLIATEEMRPTEEMPIS